MFLGAVTVRSPLMIWAATQTGREGHHMCAQTVFFCPELLQKSHFWCGPPSRIWPNDKEIYKKYKQLFKLQYEEKLARQQENKERPFRVKWLWVWVCRERLIGLHSVYMLDSEAPCIPWEWIRSNDLSITLLHSQSLNLSFLADATDFLCCPYNLLPLIRHCGYDPLPWVWSSSFTVMWPKLQRKPNGELFLSSKEGMSAVMSAPLKTWPQKSARLASSSL